MVSTRVLQKTTLPMYEYKEQFLEHTHGNTLVFHLRDVPRGAQRATLCSRAGSLDCFDRLASSVPVAAIAVRML